MEKIIELLKLKSKIDELNFEISEVMAHKFSCSLTDNFSSAIVHMAEIDVLTMQKEILLKELENLS